MAKALFTSTETQWFDDDGDPLAGGLIYFYEPGTTTLKNTYDEADLATANTNPVVLDANGRGVIWLNGEYKYKVTTALGVDVGAVVDNLNTEPGTSVESGLLIANGSFEIDTEGLGQPDDWTIAPLAGATIAIDTTDSAHGLNSLKFLSGGAGGGTATSNRFNVLKGQSLLVIFTYKASSATVKTIVDVKTYDKNGLVISVLPAYTATTGNPATYTTITGQVTVDPTAVTAELIITGIDAAGTITSGLTTHFDNISVPIDTAGRGALALHTSVNTIATATRTVINFQSEDYDTDDIHDNATNNTRLTVPVGVTKVKVIGRVNLAGGGTGTHEGRILKNGSPTYNGAPTIEMEGLPLGDVDFNLASTVLTVVAGDYFEFDVYQASGGNKNTRIGGENTWFAMEVVK